MRAGSQRGRIQFSRTSTRVQLDTDLPFGLNPGRCFRVQEFPLAPGDLLAFLTDGMVERNAAQLDVAKALSQTRDLHPRETVHELGAAGLNATGGDLRDDATVLMLDWYGGPPRLPESTTEPAGNTPRPRPPRGTTACATASTNSVAVGAAAARRPSRRNRTVPA
jgi:hypothetical protein